MDDSFRLAEAVGLGIWQFVLLYAAFASNASISRWPLVVAHLVVLTVAGLIAVRRAAVWPVLPLMCLVLLLDYRAVTEVASVLWFTCFWTSLICTGLPIILLPLKRAVWLALLALGSTVGGQLWWHSQVGIRSPLLTISTALTLAIAMVMLMGATRASATKADEHESHAARERERLVLQRNVAQAAAEDARVMHDMLINTLSTIAGGRRVVNTGVVEVRERCRRDAEGVDAILRGHQPDEGHRSRLIPLSLPHGLRLRRAGMDADEVERLLTTLPRQVGRAVQRSVHELVRNPANHSRADCATLEMRTRGNSLRIAVSDDGCGFDGRLIPGRGLAESVIARSRDAGVDVTILTAPGKVTAVTLTVPLDATPPSPAREPPTSPEATHQVVDMVQRTACWRFATVIVGFGAVYIGLGRPERPGAACLMLAMVAATAWLSARACRDGRALPGWMTVVVLLAIPLSFLAGLASINFGRSDVTGWPTIVVTALPIILLITRRSRTAFVIGAALLVSTASVTAYLVWRVTPSAAAVIPAGVVAQLALVSAWVVLRQVMDSVGAQHQRSLREIVDDRLERRARERLLAARDRWVAAGARRSVTVLRHIANAEAHPADPAVQRECAEAERYLRQVLLMNPDIVHMSPWIGRAVSVARDTAVAVNLRPRPVDTPDDALATAFGQVIMHGLDVLEPGSELSLGLFPGTQGPQLLLVGPRDSLQNLTTPIDLPAPYALTYRQYEKQDVVELTAIECPEYQASPDFSDLPISVGCRG